MRLTPLPPSNMNAQQDTELMQEFNLTADSLASLPKGLPAELNALLAQRNALLDAAQWTATVLADGELLPSKRISAALDCLRVATREATKSMANVNNALAQGGGK